MRACRSLKGVGCLRCVLLTFRLFFSVLCNECVASLPFHTPVGSHPSPASGSPSAARATVAVTLDPSPHLTTRACCRVSCHTKLFSDVSKRAPRRTSSSRSGLLGRSPSPSSIIQPFLSRRKPGRCVRSSGCASAKHLPRSPGQP